MKETGRKYIRSNNNEHCNRFECNSYTQEPAKITVNFSNNRSKNSTFDELIGLIYDAIFAGFCALEIIFDAPEIRRK